MSAIPKLYRPNLATLTDLYELTMAAGYARAGVADRQSVFTLAFRGLPFGGGYAIAAGLDDVLQILEALCAFAAIGLHMSLCSCQLHRAHIS